MKFTTVIVTLLAAAATSVDAKPHSETNAMRLARGLSPLPPARRATGVAAARRSQPSSSGGIHNSCNAGPVQCCNSVTHATPLVSGLLKTLLGVVVPANVAVGFTCSPLSVIGIGGSTCKSQPVCCENNEFNGLIAIGCSPININL